MPSLNDRLNELKDSHEALLSLLTAGPVPVIGAAALVAATASVRNSRVSAELDALEDLVAIDFLARMLFSTRLIEAGRTVPPFVGRGE